MNDDPFYATSPIKRRKRRTRAQMDELDSALRAIVAEYRPVTVRQTFYQASVRGLVPKTEQGYKNDVDRRLVKMRRDGLIPYGWIADNTRWMRKPRTFASLERALEDTARLYRRSLWQDQDVYVEIWCEKDALAGVVYEETAKWDVPLMVPRGFSSVTYLYEAAQTMAAQNRPVYLYYFGDRDPSGVHIDRNIERGLREMAPHAEIHFQRVAVKVEQIAAWNLPTRPTKRSDSRSKDFVGDSVEVDSIAPPQLRALVRGCIEPHVDPRRLDVCRIAERSEKEILNELAAMKWRR